jgi:hypothetical protein
LRFFKHHFGFAGNPTGAEDVSDLLYTTNGSGAVFEVLSTLIMEQLYRFCWAICYNITYRNI